MKPNNIILGNYHLNKPVYLLKSKFKDGGFYINFNKIIILYQNGGETIHHYMVLSNILLLIKK